MTDLTVVVCVAFDRRACSTDLAKFKECLMNCPHVDTALEVAGSFDLILQGKCLSLAEYTENMDRIRDPLANFVTRLETNFVAKKTERKNESEDGRVVWLPCEHGIKRIDAQSIDKIIAEGDYMRVHVGEWNCLVHRTMHRLAEQLGSARFIQLHRSALIRIDFIERLIHDQRRWKAHLRDGTYINIAKSHTKEAVGLIMSNSPKLGGHPSTKSYLTEGSKTVNEIEMRTLG